MSDAKELAAMLRELAEQTSWMMKVPVPHEDIERIAVELERLAQLEADVKNRYTWPGKAEQWDATWGTGEISEPIGGQL